MASLIESPLALPLRNSNYGIYSLGNAISLIGTWMQRISVGWLTWELTHSGLWLGVVAFADFFPVLVVGPVAGAAADRWDRLRVVKTSQTISLVQAAVLFVLTASGHINIWLLVALTTFQGMVVAFNQPARLALVPSLVGQADLAAAVAISSVIFNLARFVGPMLAGLVIVWQGVPAAFAANALTYLVFLFALMRVCLVSGASKPTKKRSFKADFEEGLGYTARHPAIASMLMLLIAIGIGVRPLNELLPGLASEVFRSGAGGLSIFVSATGAGAIMAGLWLGHSGHKSNLTSVALGASFISALAAMVVSTVTSMWIAVPAIAVFGFCVSSAGTAIQTLVQLASDQRMRGRVMGLYGLVFRGAPAIGALAVGLASARLGLQWPIVIGAGVVMIVCLWTYSKRGQITAALPM
ncbi:MAG: MFS transporter [Candidatus Sulfotelmatobacter sp.]